MLQDSSDTAYDTGRMDSERQIRNKPTSRWLDDVVRQADGDRAEVVATIEGLNGGMNDMHTNFLPSLESALDTGDTATAIDRNKQVQALLTNASTLLKVYHRADGKITTTFSGQDSPEAMQKNHAEDVQKVKDVMLVGRRLCAGELEGVEQQARASELMGRKEVFEQAAGIFGGGLKKGADGSGEGVDRMLGYVEKGVRRMVKGMQ